MAVLGTLHLIRQHTKLGRALRATTQNPVAAQLLGVDVERISAIGMGGPVVGAILIAPAQAYFAYRFEASHLYLIAYAVLFLGVIHLLPDGIVPPPGPPAIRPRL